MSFNFKKFKKTEFRKGMTYVELIVVLSIFSIMSAISLFDYRKFEAKVEIKNLANDIALQIVDAQKSAMAGKIPATLGTGPSWIPAHGVHFDLTDQHHFTAFADTDSDNVYGGSYEDENVIEITKNVVINHLEFTGNDCGNPSGTMDIVFRRPDSTALVAVDGIRCGAFKSALVGIESPDGAAGKIYIYPTGRIEIK